MPQEPKPSLAQAVQNLRARITAYRHQTLAADGRIGASLLSCINRPRHTARPRVLARQGLVGLSNDLHQRGRAAPFSSAADGTYPAAFVRFRLGGELGKPLLASCNPTQPNPVNPPPD